MTEEPQVNRAQPDWHDWTGVWRHTKGQRVLTIVVALEVGGQLHTENHIVHIPVGDLGGSLRVSTRATLDKVDDSPTAGPSSP